eukprot:2670199-Amphidinium_carterae.1
MSFDLDPSILAPHFMQVCTPRSFSWVQFWQRWNCRVSGAAALCGSFMWQVRQVKYPRAFSVTDV